tara:strand:+ start:1440 stop:2297 length:858 start_codon:yes stop_codon:yes gene_type:complete
MNYSFLKKLVLGTANFVNNYGATNNSTRPNRKEIFKMLEYAIKKKINKFDTAPSYKSEEILGDFIKVNKLRNIEITTKIPSMKLIKNKVDFIKQNLIISQKKLNTNINNVLFHDQRDILFFLNNQKMISEIKKDFMIKKFGASIYDTKYVKLVNKIKQSIIIQFPGSIANTKFFNKKFKKKDNLFVRSIFLQGLLTKNKIKKKLPNKLLYAHKKYINYLDNNKIKSLELCLGFINRQKMVNHIIIGVDNIKQLKSIVGTNFLTSVDKVKYVKKLFNMNAADPRKW